MLCITFKFYSSKQKSIMTEPTWQYSFTFTFMHLADAFNQSDLQCIQALHFFFISMFKSNFKGQIKQKLRFKATASHMLFLHSNGVMWSNVGRSF